MSQGNNKKYTWKINTQPNKKTTNIYIYVLDHVSEVTLALLKTRINSQKKKNKLTERLK